MNYFGKYFGTDRPLPPPLVTEPEPGTEDANVRITEYSIPAEGARKGSIAGSLVEGAAILPHNLTITPEGVVWFAQNAANRIGRLDPRTGQFRSYPLPTPGSRPSGIDWALDGSIWFTEEGGLVTTQGARLKDRFANVGRLDPDTGAIREFRAPAGSSIIKDSKGNMFWTGFGNNQIGQINTKTFEIKLYDLLTPDARPYGIVVDQKDRVWWCQFYVDSIGMLNPTTGKITEYRTPKLSSPRRITVDKKGNIWFGAWRTSKIDKLDPESGEITEYALPTPNSDLYDVMVDVDDTVWAAALQSNILAHLDPATGKIVEYPIPTPKSEIRKMIADPKQGVWFAGSNVDTIGHIFVKR